MAYSKMYIVVRDSVIKKDPAHARLSVAHAMAAAAELWFNDPIYRAWAEKSFRKVLCRAEDSEITLARMHATEVGIPFKTMTESALDGDDTCVVFRPSCDYPGYFKKLGLWQ